MQFVSHSKFLMSFFKHLSDAIPVAIPQLCKVTVVLEKIRNYVSRHALYNLEDQILVAVSGGMDSMFLLHYLMQSGVQTQVAHVNFKLRGAMSDADEQFVAQYCAQHRIPFYTRSFDTESYAREHNLSVQMAARRLRYTWFDQLCAELGCTLIATAHHATDQVETVLINQLRGTGIGGLTGIRPVSGRLIRPLLCLNRTEIAQYVREQSIPYREDLSNLGDDYARNRIRHHVLPVFESINPEFTETFAKNSEHLTEARQFILFFMEEIKSQVIESDNEEGWILNTDKLKKFPETGFILFHLLHPYGFNRDQIQQLAGALEHIPGKIFHSPSHRLVTGSHGIQLEIRTRSDKERIEIHEHSRSVEFHKRLWEFETTENLSISRDKNVAVLDFQLLRFPLTLRPWEAGDRIKPLGMKGSKKISDILTDLKLNRIQKEHTLVLVSGDEIVWLAGWVLNRDYRITERTSRVFKVTLNP